jgi:hypothetical protein
MRVMKKNKKISLIDLQIKKNNVYFKTKEKGKII